MFLTFLILVVDIFYICGIYLW